MLVRGLVIAAVVAITGGVVLAYLGTEAHVVDVEAGVPSAVVAGQPFDVTLTVRNVSNDSLAIVSIGLERSELQVIETVPGFRRVDESRQW